MSEIGHNSNETPLTEDQRKALGFIHRGRYSEALKAKKAADAAFKNVCKKALADGVTVDQIKLLIQLDEEGGEEKFRKEIENRLEVARWAGAQVGTQFSFLDEPDRSPLVDKAYEDGKRLGMAGKDAPQADSGEVDQARLKGWHDGQAVLMETLEITANRESVERAKEAAQAEEGPKKRGRPKGSKNKTKDEPEIAEGEASPFDEAA